MLFAGVAIVAIFANISQVGFVFSGVKIQKGLTFEQGLNVVANAKNLFSKRSLVTFLNSVIKVIIICYVSYYVITHDKRLATDIFSCRSDVLCALEVGASRIWWIMVYVVLALVPIAALDYLIQRKIYLTENMMSHDEVEKEYKEMEGDPHMKSHRRKMAQEIATGDGFARAKNASAIIRNPTHVAIALRYEPQTMALPYVVALGTDAEALEIIAHAEENGVPSYIDIPLARAMINDCAVDQFVPLQYMDQMVKFSAWLSLNHPERVFDTPEFGMASVGGFGDVKRG
jgi:type III secretion protein U